MRAVIQEEEGPHPLIILHTVPLDFKEMKEEAAKHSELQWNMYFNH